MSRHNQFPFRLAHATWKCVSDEPQGAGIYLCVNCLKSSGHYIYRTVVTICTAQRSLCVPHSGHYMYRTTVTICTAQRSLYVPHNGHYMTRSQTLRFHHTLYLCVSTNGVKQFDFVIETQCVFCRTGTQLELTYLL